MKRFFALVAGATALTALALVATSCSSLPTFTAGELPTTAKVTDQGGWIALEPSAGTSKTVGLVFYPGGLVKPEAYELVLAPIAAAGYPVVIVKMPFDLAFFGAENGLAAKKAFPSVTKWAIGGHSLGGTASAIAVGKHPTEFAGVVFWASYTVKDYDLSNVNLPVLSISASNDGLATPDKVAAGKPFVPTNTEYDVIDGGIHAQFGTYGPQKGDGTATISREQQQAQVVKLTLDFLAKL
jgi:hypothetical protein